jgi:hypothetical protein
MPRLFLNPQYSKPINPDGVEIKIRWSLFPVGASVFIPALNLSKLIKQVHREAELRGIRLVHAERIEAGKLGVRFWRAV